MAIQFHPVPHGITWTHYRVVGASPDGFDAQTGYEMRAHYSIVGSDGDVRLRNVVTLVRIDPAESWVVKGSKTPALLQHESLHYLIATLIGRELDNELGTLTGTDATSLQRAADQLVVDKTARAQAIGEAYDSDTNHGVDASQQAAWVARVHAWEQQHNQVTWP